MGHRVTPPAKITVSIVTHTQMLLLFLTVTQLLRSRVDDIDMVRLLVFFNPPKYVSLLGPHD